MYKGEKQQKIVFLENNVVMSWTVFLLKKNKYLALQKQPILATFFIHPCVLQFGLVLLV